MRTNSVKRALKEGKAQVGTWLSLVSPFAARFMARAGFHWLTLDIEHSPVDWETAAAIFGAVADAGCVPLARVPAIRHDYVKRALDAGAYGIVFPMCCSADEAQEAVSACKYPPYGRRSVGGGLHTLNFDALASEYYARANDEILVIIQAEHYLAVEQCEEIFAVPGLDAMFVGPNDLLASMGKTPAMETDDPEFVAALNRLREAAVRNGIAPGLHTADAQMALRRIREGWRFVAISSELGFMMTEAARTVKAAIGEGPREGVSPRY